MKLSGIQLYELYDMAEMLHNFLRCMNNDRKCSLHNIYGHRNSLFQNMQMNQEEIRMVKKL